MFQDLLNLMGNPELNLIDFRLVSIAYRSSKAA